MKHTDNSSSKKTINQKAKKPRVFARMISYQLTEEELHKVSGGESFSCQITRYPNFDTTCDL